MKKSWRNNVEFYLIGLAGANCCRVQHYYAGDFLVDK